MSAIEPKTITLRDGTEIALRSPTGADAAHLLDYLDAIRRDTPYILWAPEDALPSLQAEAQWAQARHDGDGITIVAEDDGQMVAVCGIERPGPFTRVAHTADLGISILTPWRGRGLGTLLMGELLGWANAHPDVTVATLGVFADNPRARALYERFGFEQTGRKRWHIRRSEQYIDELLMSKWVGPPEAMPA